MNREASRDSAIGEYQQIPSLHEIDTEGVGPSEWDHIQNLDSFLTRVYKYYEEKGLYCILTSRILNLLTLGFTISFSGFLLLYVDWQAARSGCEVEDDCDFIKLAIYTDPVNQLTAKYLTMVITYLIIFSLYWVWNIVRLIADLPGLVEIHRFCCVKLGLSHREIQTMEWSELVSRLVMAQSTMRLCVVKELTALDVVSRIMRKENYLIGMLNKDVLCLQVPIPWISKRVMLTKTLEWNIYWCILDCMFDDNFLIQRSFLEDEAALRKRLALMSIFNLLLSPFLVLFLVMYFFLTNAEKIYHHPSSICTRGWSALAKWTVREFNELPHFLEDRLNKSYSPASKYVAQFPSPIISMIAKFVSFVIGAVAAFFIALALVDERLMEAQLFGRKLLWYVALFSTLLAISRAVITSENMVFDPESAMREVVKFTHYLPRHWRNRAHHQEVQQEFEELFQYQGLFFLEEMLSIFITPFILWFSLPKGAGAVISFVRNFTTHVDGVGDVCSLSVFDFERHGNASYAAPHSASKEFRSCQGKMEKSFLTFQAAYPDWEPAASGQEMLRSISYHRGNLTKSMQLGSHAASPFSSILAPRADYAALGQGAGVIDGAGSSLHTHTGDPSGSSQRDLYLYSSHMALQEYYATSRTQRDGTESAQPQSKPAVFQNVTDIL